MANDGENLSFGQWLKRRRRALDLTQAALAAQIGCSESAFRKIESGQRRPSRQVVTLLGAHLAVEPDDCSRLMQWARGAAAIGPARPAAPPGVGLPTPLT